VKNIETKVKHSESKSAWNVVGTILGGKYKIARIPYVPSSDPIIDTRERTEALKYATFISRCFNNAEKISESL